MLYNSKKKKVLSFDLLLSERMKVSHAEVGGPQCVELVLCSHLSVVQEIELGFLGLHHQRVGTFTHGAILPPLLPLQWLH